MSCRIFCFALLGFGVAIGSGCTTSTIPVDGGSDDGGPPPTDDITVPFEAWISGRIVYADFAGGAVVTIEGDGSDPENLVEAERPASPAISGDGGTIAFSQRERDDDQLVVVHRGGTIHRYEGITGRDPLRVALNRDGTKIAFQEVTPPSPTNGCGPIHLAIGNADGTELAMVVTGESICAEWPEWSPDGTLLSYAHVDLSAEHPGRLCMLDGATMARTRCFDEPVIGISHRTWSPDSTLLMGQGFRTMRVIDGQEVTDPLNAVTGGEPQLASGELLDAILDAAQAVGWSLIPGGMSGDVLPISLNWSPNNVLVFDALASSGGGSEAVHIFTYDLATGIAAHVAGPFPESNTNNHNYSLATPRWVP